MIREDSAANALGARSTDTGANRSQLDQDSLDLKKLGYVQELAREMKAFSNFAVSFSVISILTGITQLYGYGLQHGGPFQTSVGWLMVSAFTMTVALAMAELASAYPTAGALYHWASYLGGKRLGWFTACFNTIGQFAILAGIDYGLTLFLVGLAGLPDTWAVKTSLYAALLFSHAFLNHIGIRVVAWLNDFSAWYHVAVVALLLGALAVQGFAQPVSFLFTFNSTDGMPSGYSFLIGLLLAQWTLTGYDASAHVSEETKNPREAAPRGIFSAVGISIVAGFLMLAFVTLSIPDLATVTAIGESAFSHILKLRLGETMGTTVLALIAGAMWLCGLSAMTSASRMVYAFARDGGLPFSKFWATVSTSHRTPSNAIWGLAAFAVTLALSVSVYSAIVGIATISLYISYGIPIFARLVARQRGEDRVKGPWNLGRFSTLNSIVAITWISIITVVFVLPPNEQAAYVVAGCLAALIAIWAIVARKRFVGPKINF